jgi:hypothetical protein
VNINLFKILDDLFLLKADEKIYLREQTNYLNSEKPGKFKTNYSKFFANLNYMTIKECIILI